MSGRRILAVAVALFVAAAVVLALAERFDAATVAWMEGWRTCTLQRLVVLCTDWLRTLGGVAVGVVLVRHLARGPRPRLWTALELLAALGAGGLVVEGLKRVVDRPRPGASLLGELGHSLPSGHLANTVFCGLVVLFLWRGHAGVPLSRAAWLLLASLGAFVAAARVYAGHHWPSDVLATAALATGFGLLAMRHPDQAWRTGVTTAATFLAAGLFAGQAAGWRVRLPTGGLGAEVARVSIPAAIRARGLRHGWAEDAAQSPPSDAWLVAPAGRIHLETLLPRVDQIRLVVRPAWKAHHRACRELRVRLNGVEIGRRLLHLGWRAYVFPVGSLWHAAGENVLDLRVGRGQRGRRPRPPLAAFREVSLHVARAPR